MPDGSSPQGDWLLCMGTRPEIIKMAPVYHALRATGDAVRVLHTGQHDEMAWPLYRFFGMQPDHSVELKRAREGLANLAAELLAGIGEHIKRNRPRTLLVHGDTLSAFAAATAGFFAQVPVGHVEAGLRTHTMYDPFPEEKNRELIGRLATFHFAPTAQARANLLREGIADASIVVTGNTVVDATRLAVARLDQGKARLVDDDVRDFLSAHSGKRLLLITAHRRENWGAGIQRIAHAVAQVLREHEDVAAIWPVHANPAVANDVATGLAALDPSAAARLLLTSPLDYPSLIAALRRCWLVLTDSGGIQEEAVSLSVPSLVLRETTERPEIVAAGYGRLVGTDATTIVAAFNALSDDRAAHAAMRCRAGESPFGDGYAAQRICAGLLQTA